ncbi:GDP-Man:Man(1)GlcNAc(2)-PP-Dol alpha-1,3-mannosyltransferase [Citrus sinensis]|uniref:GDP-Man:Man(1)GlcNAc(2)-PP-Dol alpha-1,3-mannosyltransferase n=1 Tax=Citrus sinensis TaxID=2711 RepID=A0ACB8M085_CITSI|nr:GDP-Man:Man(1)GlcNAc(2)-PP-Dol alpha-1,3-mannosyltransferase [Citrus sinensis]
MADVILVNSKFTATTFANTFKKLHARGIHPVVLYPAVNVYQFDKPHSCELSKDIADDKRINESCLMKLKKLVFNLQSEELTLSAAGKAKLSFIYYACTNIKALLLICNQESLLAFGFIEGKCTSLWLQDEHLGIVPLEAMAAYKPVIACDSGGPVETIKNEEPQMAKKMGENARHHVMESFSTKIFGQHLNRLLAYVARAPGKAEQTIIFSNPCTPFIIIIIVIIIMYRVLIKCGLVRWEWPKGSIEETVQNAVKSWEMELSHKTSLNDFKTINPEKFKLIVNGRKGLSREESLQLGSYNALLNNSVPKEFQ